MATAHVWSVTPADWGRHCVQSLMLGHSQSSMKTSYCNDSGTSSLSSNSDLIYSFSTGPWVAALMGIKVFKNFFSQCREVLRDSEKWIPTAFPQINFTRSSQEKKAVSAKEQSALSTQGPVCHCGLPRWKMYAAIKESPQNVLIHQCQLFLTERLLTLAHC